MLLTLYGMLRLISPNYSDKTRVDVLSTVQRSTLNIVHRQLPDVASAISLCLEQYTHFWKGRNRSNEMLSHTREEAARV